MYRYIIICTLVVSFGIGSLVYAETAPQRRVRLEAQLAKIELEIQQQQTILDKKSNERQSLERDVSVLNAQIRKETLAIKQRNLSISKLSKSIGSRENAIRTLDSKMKREKDSLSQLLRKTNEIDHLSLVEMVLGKDDLSTIFSDIDTFSIIKLSLSKSFDVINATRQSIEAQKNSLQGSQKDEQELRRLQVLEQRKVLGRKKEKNSILTTTKGQEAIYKKIVKEKEKTAAEIRTTLFALRGSAAIPFGKAYDFAKEASAQTGVRPALILGILKQETNLGENVGQCLLTNTPRKGDGKGKNTGTPFRGVMKPTRDVDPFLAITTELGLNPYAMVVSCPPSYGYGGAMGPAQFIPSTWVLYKKRLAKLTATNPPNPWDPRTAIFATSLLMKDNGAGAGTRSAERLAALRYFAGWRNAKKPAYAFYGDGVMELTGKMQHQINILEGK